MKIKCSKNRNFEENLDGMKRPERVLNEDLPLAINVNLGPYCNLACSYCFANGGDYGTITRAMDESYAEKIFSLIKKNYNKNTGLRLEYFGGEPLMNFKVLSHINDWLDPRLDEMGIKLIKRISTNMTCMTEEILEFFKNNDFIISVSIDGGREVQNKQRAFKNGEGSFDIILENMRKIKEACPDTKTVARMTYHDPGDDLVENVRLLSDTGVFDYISIYPSISAWMDKEHSFKLRMIDNITNLIDEYGNLLEDFPNLKGILEFDQIISQLVHRKSSIHHCRAGTAYFTFSPDEKIVPCHRLAGDKRFSLDEITFLDEWNESAYDNETCRDCRAVSICGGGCRHEHFIATGSLNKPNPDVCLYQTSLLDGILKNYHMFDHKDYDNSLEELSYLFTNCGRQVV